VTIESLPPLELIGQPFFATLAIIAFAALDACLTVAEIVLAAFGRVLGVIRPLIG
jgi:hypothetical protein